MKSEHWDLEQERWRLPYSRSVDVPKLLQLFYKTTTSYKYLFTLSLLDLLQSTHFETLTMSFRDLARQMFFHAWYPHVFFRLSFGSADQMSVYLDALKLEWDSDKPLLPARLREYLDDADLPVNPLMRYVPSRLLQPFFSDALCRVPDGKKDKMIVHLAREHFEDLRPLYYIDPEGECIVMNQYWMLYLYDNYDLVRSFVKWTWLEYMQRRNPSVPNLQAKLFPPPAAPGLLKESAFWRKVLEYEPVRCIYSRKPIDPGDISLDHFVPWSFVAHNQLWNLVPVPRVVNSSKSNKLPSMEHYFGTFSSLQYQGLKLFHSKASPAQWRKTIEPYLADLKLSEQDLLDERKLSEQLRLTITPLISLAENMGFPSGWVYQG